MPEPRKGGANGFRSLKVYQDGERRIRFHIYPPGEASNDHIAQDNLAHQHYGCSASIILAGNLVNQHFKATPTHDPETELALYRVKPDFDPTIDPVKAVRSAKTLTYHQGVHITRVSSQVYKAGDYYHLPKPISLQEEKQIPYALEDSDRLDYHKVGNRELTATFWSLKYPSQTTEYDFSVLPRTSPKTVTVEYGKKNVDKKEFYALLLKTDHKIRQEIASVNKVSTMLDRGKRELFSSRSKFYVQQKIPYTATHSDEKKVSRQANTFFMTPTATSLIKTILAINIGSSSIKFSLLKLDENQQNPRDYIEGQIEINKDNFTFRVKDLEKNQELAKKKLAYDTSKKDTYDVALKETFDWIKNNVAHCKIEAICHRVLHGADKFPEHVKITPENIRQMEELISISPLHQPYNVAGIKWAYQSFSNIPQFACFDTAFHSTISPINRAITIAPQTTPIKIQQYGFHGLSYEYIVSQLPTHLGNHAAKGKIIIAHLGGGCTLCAVKDGKSVAATGGFSKLDGLVMGSRSGSVDPGVMLYLLKYLSVNELQTLLYFNSGLKGISQKSSDMRILLANEHDEPSKNAIELYVRSIQENIAKLATKLGGVDAIVFTGGTGENRGEIREKVCQGLSWLGIELDQGSNKVNDARISVPSSKVSVLVIPTNENVQMAKHAARLLTEEQQKLTKRLAAS